MHILIPVYFNSSMGGLHLNVFSTIQYLTKTNNIVTVICKEGEFSNLLRKSNVNVIICNFEVTDFRKTIDQVIKVHEQSPIDIIHTHPFNARKLALAINKVIKVPLFTTIHGRYTDDLTEYIDQLSMVFTVSEGIKNYLWEKTKISQKEKFAVIPNGVNRKIFNTNFSFTEKIKLGLKNKEDITISLASRLDKDKQFIIDIYYDALKHTASNYKNIRWKVIGDGTKLEEMKIKTKEITGDDSTVSFLGWKKSEDLAWEFKTSDIIFSPGRSALEGMGCGKPVIALGSKKYVGLIKPENWLQGMYTNFGGVGKKHVDYQVGSVENDLDYILKSTNTITTLGTFGEQIISLFYDEDVINHRLLSYYKLFSTEKSVESKDINVNEIIEAKVKNIDIEKVSKYKYVVTLETFDDNSLEYSWNIYRNNKLYETIPYSPNSFLEYEFKEDGTFMIEVNIKDVSNQQFKFILEKILL